MGSMMGGLGSLGGMMGGGKGKDNKSGKGGKSKGGMMGMLHSGGKVPKTGNYRLRKNEVVLTVGQQKAAGLKKKSSKKTTGKRPAAKE